MLHDLGNFASAFQGLRQDLSVDLVKANPRMCYSERHDSLGFCLWKQWSQQLSDLESGDSTSKAWLSYLEPWLEIVTGHHGMPPKKSPKEKLSNYFEAEDEQAALEL